MIKKIIIIGVVIILAIFQIVAIQFFSFFNIWPHLIIILMVLALFTDYEEIALYAAAFGGLVLDLVSPARFGLNIILLFIFYFLIKYLIKTKLFENNPVNALNYSIPTIAKRDKTPIEILEDRYARGDISDIDFANKLRLLKIRQDYIKEDKELEKESQSSQKEEDIEEFGLTESEKQEKALKVLNKTKKK